MSNHVFNMNVNKVECYSCKYVLSVFLIFAIYDNWCTNQQSIEHVNIFYSYICDKLIRIRFKVCLK